MWKISKCAQLPKNVINYELVRGLGIAQLFSPLLIFISRSENLQIFVIYQQKTMRNRQTTLKEVSNAHVPSAINQFGCMIVS
jgi:hypothetical protein